MKAKILLSMLIIMFVLAASLGATMAWFTAEAEVPANVFTAGTVEISAEETFVSNVEKMGNVNPGDCFVKCFEIENTGSKMIEVRLSDLVGEWDFENSVEPVYVAPVPDSGWVMKFNEDNSGYIFYYTGGPVEAGEIIELCILVVFDGVLMENEFQGGTFTLSASFEAVQASNQAPAEVWGGEWDPEWFALSGAAALLAGTDETYTAYFYDGDNFKFEACLEESNGNGGNGNGNGNEETAFGGDTAVNVNSPGAWWYYFDTSGSAAQTIWAGQTIDVGTVTVSEPDEGNVTIEINLDSGWELQAGSETVKIQGYAQGELPGSRPAAGLFTDYKGTSLTVTVPENDIYVIHLDVQENS